MCHGTWGSTWIHQASQNDDGTRAIEWALLVAQDTHSSKIFPFNSLFTAVLQFAITIKLVAFLCSSRLCNHSNKIINMMPVLHFSRVQLWSSLFFVCLQLNSALQWLQPSGSVFTFCLSIWCTQHAHLIEGKLAWITPLVFFWKESQDSQRKVSLMPL